MAFFKKQTLKTKYAHIVFSLIVLLSGIREVTGQTNSTNETYSLISLSFDQDEMTIEQNFEGSFNMILSQVVNESVTFNLTDEEGGVVQLPYQMTALTSKGNLTFVAIGAGRTTIKAETPESPYTNISITDAYVVVNVFYSQVVYVISDVVGWMYFAFWTISLYPQVIVNFKRKSVVGLDFNFVALNLLGHSSYNIFNIGLFLIPAIKAEYKRLNPAGVIPVRINDLCFSMHATFITAFTAFQCLIYERGNQKLSYTCLGMLVVMILFLLVTLVLAIVNVISWLDYLYFFSYIKLGITLFKNIPQVYYNFKRKSTKGFSIWTMMLDFVGGILSMVQMFMLAYNFNEWGSITGDLSKLGLGFISVAFDIIYMIQHYILYRQPRSKQRASVIIPRTLSETKGKEDPDLFTVRF